MNKELTATPARPEGKGSIEMLTRMNDSHKPLREWAFSFINWKSSMHILDVGCGGGATIADMLLLSEESIIDGIDYSPDSVACSKQTNEAMLGKRVFITEGNIMDLPYPDQSFDLVTAVETVYFWPDLHQSLCEIFRVLKKGGQAAILCEIDAPEKAASWGDIGCDLKVYYPEELVQALTDSGFSEAESHVKENGYMLVTGIRA